MRDSGATAFGGNVSQEVGGDLAGRDLTKIAQQNITHVAEQIVQQPPTGSGGPLPAPRRC